MSKKLYEETNIQDIAAAIREKNGSQNTYAVAQMGNAVRAIHTDPVLESLSVTENGNYLPSAGKDGFSSVAVNVAGGGGSGAVVQPLSVTQNGTYNPPSGVDGYAPVTVDVSGGGDVVYQKIMTQGRVSSTSDYETAYYDSGIDATQYDLLKVNLWKNGSVIGHGSFFTNYSGQYIHGTDGIDYRFTTGATYISCTRYSGTYFDLYVDVYGISLSNED